MKMAPGVFWGLLLVLIGLSIIIKILFGISLFRILLSLFLILTGLYLISGKKVIFINFFKDNSVMFSEKIIYITPDKNEYNVVFGKSFFYLKEYPTDKSYRIEINTVFANSEIYIPENIPVLIKVNAAFSNAIIPGNSSGFGTFYYKTPAYSENSIYLYIESNVIFGKLQINSLKNN